MALRANATLEAVTTKQEQVGRSPAQARRRIPAAEGAGACARGAGIRDRSSTPGRCARPATRSSRTPLHAAETIAGLQLDASTIAGALLHDVQEDCGRHQRRDQAALRRRGGADGRGRHQARRDLRPGGEGARRRGAHPGREPAQDVPGDGGGPARRHHQAGRPAAQHAHALGAQARGPAADRAGDDGDLRPAGRPAGHLGAEVAARRPRLPLPGAGPVQARGRRCSTPSAQVREKYVAEVTAVLRRGAGQGTASRPRSRAAPSTSTASTRRWRSMPARARAWTRSTTSSPSASWSRPSPTATPRSAWCTACGTRSRARSTTTSPTPRRTCTSRCTPR